MDWRPVRGSLPTEVMIGDYYIEIISYLRVTVLGYYEEAASGMGEKDGSHIAILFSSSLWLAGPPFPCLSFCCSFLIEYELY